MKVVYATMVGVSENCRGVIMNRNRLRNASRSRGKTAKLSGQRGGRHGRVLARRRSKRPNARGEPDGLTVRLARSATSPRRRQTARKDSHGKHGF